MREQNISSSCDAVLQTAELLQEILLQLDMRTLLTAAQLVSRQWRELIQSSPALKRALYLEPIAQSSSPPTPNPLLSELFSLWYPRRTKMLSRNDHLSIKASWKLASAHPSASWRNMLLHQPPARTLGRCTLSCSRMDMDYHFELHEFPEGLRMGSLYDLSNEGDSLARADLNIFWRVPGDGKKMHGHRMMPWEEAEFESFASRADMSMFRSVIGQYAHMPILDSPK